MDFSVLISVYSKEDPNFLDQALSSIFNQTLLPKEIVLVKDGLLTESLDKIILKWESILNNILRIIVLPQNNGLSEALNIGLHACKNEWVFRMDTDDICEPNRFERLIKHVCDYNVDIVGSWANKIDADNNFLGIIKVPVSDSKIKKLIWTSPFIHPSVGYKKSKILAVGSYNSLAGPRQDDYDLWFRCAKAGLKMHNIDEPLINYRWSDNNILKNNIRVGWARFKVGIKGCISNRCGIIAYLGVTIPLFRSLLPYPLNIWFYRISQKVNPRTK